MNIRWSWPGWQLRVAADQQSEGTPDEQSDHHDGGDLHDAQRLAAGFVNSFDVAPPEVDGDHYAEEGGERMGFEPEILVHESADFVEQAAEIEARADYADGAGEDVI